MSIVIAASYNQSWSYQYDFNTSLLSITVSVSLQSTTIHADTVNDIENNLSVNTSSVIPSGYELTNEGFMLSAFQPNSKYICVATIKYILHQQQLPIQQLTMHAILLYSTYMLSTSLFISQFDLHIVRMYFTTTYVSRFLFT